jgi:hypothetical protein
VDELPFHTTTKPVLPLYFELGQRPVVRKVDGLFARAYDVVVAALPAPRENKIARYRIRSSATLVCDVLDSEFTSDLQGRFNGQRELLTNVSYVCEPIVQQKGVVLGLAEEMMDSIRGAARDSGGSALRWELLDGYGRPVVGPAKLRVPCRCLGHTRRIPKGNRWTALKRIIER